MAQYQTWEKEYKRLSLLTGKPEPQKDVLRFIKYLKKKCLVTANGLKILDLGSGTGRNSNYLQSLDNDCIGFEISDTAINIAKNRAIELKLSTTYFKQDIGKNYPLADSSIDLIIDVMSSNSLNNFELKKYLCETYRVLKPYGYFFVKALCLDGDKNAKNLIKLSPGNEKNTYYIKELELTERVFTKDDFINIYGEYFKIIKLDKKTSYTRFNNLSYKRNFWISYLQKHES